MSKENTNTDGGKAVADERTQRGEKMLVPKTWTKEKPKKEEKVEADIPAGEIKAIVNMEAPKHYKMWLLHKKGASRKRIAELLTTNKNEGQVGNALKLYINNPEKEKEVADKLNKK